ncbi:MAG: hypothetical protein U5K73_00790 [Halofilum sp. (in: g-proteobacteria)]|nr:hypothetical protein [Halofilum sp. (in: g-proteobacteria)]
MVPWRRARSTAKELERQQASAVRIDGVVPRLDCTAQPFAHGRFIGLDGGRVFAVGDHRHRRGGEDPVEDLGVVHQQIAGRRAHEDLDPGRGARIQLHQGVEVVAPRAEEKTVVRACAPLGAAVLVLEGLGRQRRRLRVRHLEKTGHTACDRGRRFGGDVGLVLHSGLAEVDLVVDQARQQPAAVSLDDPVGTATREVAADRVDAAILYQQIALDHGFFIDDADVREQQSGHDSSLD